MAKDDTDRITDTLNFIQNSDQGTMAERARAWTLANNYVLANHPPAHAGHAVHGPAHQAFSQGMSMSNVNNAGSREQRHMRRAIYLLWHAMGAGGWHAGNAQTTASGNLATAYRDLLLKARIVYDGSIGTDHGLRNLLTTRIRADPIGFLQHNVLKIDGSAVNAPDALDRNLVNFRLNYSAPNDRFHIQPVGGAPAPAGSYTFQAASVAAQHWTTPPGRGLVPTPGAAGPTFANIAGTRLDGADIMVTTQFTGCSFCVKNTGGAIYGAHISPSVPGAPNPHPSAPTMAGQLAGLDPNVGAGDFANLAGAAPFHVYGMGHSNIAGHPGGYPVRGPGSLDTMYLLGLRTAGVWSIYSQHIHTSGSIMGAYQIV